jgi:hypothetical protein
MTPSELRLPEQDVRGKVRSADPTPSWYAAAMIDPEGELIIERAVLGILETYGALTHDDIWREYTRGGGRKSPSRVRHIVRALVDEEQVKKADEKGTSSSGFPSSRWELV